MKDPIKDIKHALENLLDTVYQAEKAGYHFGGLQGLIRNTQPGGCPERIVFNLKMTNAVRGSYYVTNQELEVSATRETPRSENARGK